jgi:integrase
MRSNAQDVKESRRVRNTSAKYSTISGSRKGELLKLRWHYLVGDAVCVPASDTKTRKPRTIALTPELEEIIARRRESRVEGCDLIFPHMQS